MKQHYLIRLDDACPTMNKKRWGRIETVLNKNGVKPLVGVIPHNEDPLNIIDTPDALFWSHIKEWDNQGWAIAMHGYNHKYDSLSGLEGLNPLWKESEFVGVPLEVQRFKIREGIAIMRNHGIDPMFFFAPSHTFDQNTLLALYEETRIRIISDCRARKPYKWGDFIFIPQQSGHPISLPFGGYVTICYHPNTMDDNAINKMEQFIVSNSDSIMSFDQLDLTHLKGKDIIDRALSWVYFTKRRLR